MSDHRPTQDAMTGTGANEKLPRPKGHGPLQRGRGARDRATAQAGPLAIPYRDNSGRIDVLAGSEEARRHKGPDGEPRHRLPAAFQGETPSRRAGSRQGGDPRTTHRYKRNHNQAGGDRRRPSHAAVKQIKQAAKRRSVQTVGFTVCIYRCLDT